MTGTGKLGRRAAALLAVAAAFTVAGCATQSNTVSVADRQAGKPSVTNSVGQSAADAGVPSASAPSTPDPSASGFPSLPGGAPPATTGDDFAADLALTITTVEFYWREQFTKNGLAFQPVNRIVPYTKAGEVKCGGQGTPLMNAFYCPQGDFLTYDRTWVEQEYNQLGDAFVYFLIGHEYGHAIQQRLHVTSLVSITTELQADCLSGAYLGDSMRAEVLNLEPGDIEELKRSLMAVGDAQVVWFAPDAHGSAAQRTASFADGYRNSHSACHLDRKAMEPRA